MYLIRREGLMMKGKNIKKVTKRFSNFAKEERWLEEMLKEGWMLKSYTEIEVDNYEYTFKRVDEDEIPDYIFKIDFRYFKKKEDFEEYKEIFEQTGWTLLSKSKNYSKHIFYTHSSNPQQDIFSDKESYKEREKQKMSHSFIFGIVSILFTVVLIILYFMFERASLTDKI